MWPHVITCRMRLNRSHHIASHLHHLEIGIQSRCMQVIASHGHLWVHASAQICLLVCACFMWRCRPSGFVAGAAFAAVCCPAAAQYIRPLPQAPLQRAVQVRPQRLQAMARVHIPAWLLRSCLPPLLRPCTPHATSPSRGCPSPSCIQTQSCTHRFRQHAVTHELSYAFSLCRPHTVFQMVYPFGKWSQSSAVVLVLSRIWLSIHRIPSLHMQRPCQPPAQVMAASKPSISLKIQSCALSLLHVVTQRHGTCTYRLP